MKLGIIGAIECEVSEIISEMEETTTTEYVMRSFISGKLYGTETVVVTGGIGKVNAAISAQALIEKFGVTHILVTGVAGGMEQTLHIGDTVIAEEVCYHDADDMIYTDHPKMDSPFFPASSQILKFFGKAREKNEFTQKVKFGRIVTGDTFIEDEGRESIIGKYHPLCVDMESAAIAHVCYVSRIPFAVVRSMSDTQSERGIGTFEDNCAKAADNSAAVVLAAVKCMSQEE